MPTYQYDCSKCGLSFEFYQSMKDDALEVCPKEKCGRKRWGRGKVHRQVGTGAGIIFKGSGFYITDYRSEGYKESAKKEAASNTSGNTSGGDTGSGKKAETPKAETPKSDTPSAKPAAKPASKPDKNTPS